MDRVGKVDADKAELHICCVDGQPNFQRWRDALTVGFEFSHRSDGRFVTCSDRRGINMQDVFLAHEPE